MERSKKQTSNTPFIIWSIIEVIYFAIVVTSISANNILSIILGVLPALLSAIFVNKNKKTYKFMAIYGFIILFTIILIFLNFFFKIIDGLDYMFLAILFLPYPLTSIVLLFTSKLKK